jgi:hypothetical protein
MARWRAGLPPPPKRIAIHADGDIDDGGVFVLFQICHLASLREHLSRLGATAGTAGLARIRFWAPKPEVKEEAWSPPRGRLRI